MNFTSSATSRCRRGATALTGLALLAAPIAITVGPASAAGEDEGWTYRIQSVSTTVAQGYQSVWDQENRKFYSTDAKATSTVRQKVNTYDADDNITGWHWAYSTTPGSAQIVEIDAETKAVSANYSYMGLSRLSGEKESEHVLAGGSSMRSHFSPNGLAVDHDGIDGNGDPVFVSVHVRQRLQNDPESTGNLGYGGGIVIFEKSAKNPTDADRLWKLDNATPILDNARQVTVNSATDKAYVASMGAKNGNASRPGHITVIDLATKAVEARIALPLRDGAYNQADETPLTNSQSQGAVDVAVDEENEIAYPGLIVSNGGSGTYKVPAIAIDVSDTGLDKTDAKDLNKNADKVSILEETVVTHNARPYFDAETKRVYYTSYSNETVNGVENGGVTIMNADPDSPQYGTIIGEIKANYINSSAVDNKRGIIYLADNRTNMVKAYDLKTLKHIIDVPGTSRVNDIAVDEVTGEVWVGMFSFSGASADRTDVIKIHAPGTAPVADDSLDFDVTNTTSAYGKAGSTKVVVTDEDGRAATGTVTLMGAGKPIKAKLKRGEASFKLPATLAAGKHSLTFAYTGNAKSSLAAGGTTATHTVIKAVVKASVKVTGAKKAKKAGKATVTLNQKASGKVTITLKKGKATKRVSGNAVAGKVTIKLPKLKAGAWKLTASYAGSTNFGTAAVTTTVKVK